jgi:hypothetical protein
LIGGNSGLANGEYNFGSIGEPEGDASAGRVGDRLFFRGGIDMSAHVEYSDSS